MEKLTKKQHLVLKMIEREYKQHGVFPSLSRISEALGFKSRNTAVCYIKALEKKGYLQPKTPEHASYALPNTQEQESGNLRLPLVATIAAGVPRQTYDQHDRFLDLNLRFFGKGTITAVNVVGDSMTGDAIADGDIALIQLGAEAQGKDIVAVRVATDEITLKRIRRNTPSGATIELIASNPKIPTRSVAAEDVEVLGKLVGVIRRL